MSSYDKIARFYLADRDKLKSGKYLRRLLKILPKNSTILDLGCGAGVPVDDMLLKAGHSVIGIDSSSEQIELARTYCKQGQYLVGDISKLKNNEYRVEAVVSFYAVFHIERTRQADWFKVVASLLVKGGKLLVTMGDREFEGKHMLYGQELWSSQYGTVKNSQMIQQAGFEILLEEIDTSGGERHQVILAEKIC